VLWGANFEPIVKNLENPLLVLGKYFSYLANLKRMETDGMPQYSPIYQSYEKFGGNLITAVAKPSTILSICWSKILVFCNYFSYFGTIV